MSRFVLRLPLWGLNRSLSEEGSDFDFAGFFHFVHLASTKVQSLDTCLRRYDIEENKNSNRINPIGV